MSFILDAIWKLFGLLGTLDETGEGYEPSPLSKMLAVASKSDYKVEDFGKKYSGNKKVLVVCTEIRYMVMENGKKFSSGNHPVELVQPILHLINAGFDFDIATPTGEPAKIEEWALPLKDDVVMEAYKNTFKPKLDKPLSLANVVAAPQTMDQYVLVYLPGGQGAMLGLPEDKSLETLLLHFKATDKHVMSVCHGPASFLAAKSKQPHIFAGYKVACFPDSGDKISPSIGYMPGKQTWYFGEKLTEQGIEIINKDPDDTVSHDRKLITGASPRACQGIGVAAAKALLEQYA